MKDALPGRETGCGAREIPARFASVSNRGESPRFQSCQTACSRLHTPPAGPSGEIAQLPVGFNLLHFPATKKDVQIPDSETTEVEVDNLLESYRRLRWVIGEQAKIAV